MPVDAKGVDIPLWPGRYIFGEEKWVEIDGCRMRYLRGGSGPPLVFVHGLMGYSFSWRRNLEAFAKKYTVYAVDLPGIGFSERPKRGYEFDQQSIARRLMEWMQSLGMRDAGLIGTSHGGAIAMLMADLDQQQGAGVVGRMVLVASVNPWSAVGRKRIRFFSHPVGALCLRSFTPALSMLRDWGLRRMYADPGKITQDTCEGYDAPLKIRGTVDYLLGIVEYWQQDVAKLEGVIERISGRPILLLWGDVDTAVPVESGYELHRHLTGSEMVVFKGVGHLPYEESPEEFNRVVLGYLSGGVVAENVTTDQQRHPSF